MDLLQFSRNRQVSGVNPRLAEQEPLNARHSQHSHEIASVNSSPQDF